MNIYPITYKETEYIYSHEGLKLLSSKLTTLDYTAEEQRIEAIRCVNKISSKLDLWKKMISVSFMSEHRKESYLSLLDERITRLEL